jgi:cell division protein ZapA (FtsZ GTPase activity inhibitor)
MKTVRVKIGNQEYNLRSDNEAKLRAVADQVDRQFRQVQAATQEPSTATLSMLAALNVAEEGYELRQQQQVDNEYLASEIEKMMQFLQQSYGEE